MDRDEWCGWFQTFAEERMKDAPDETCRAIAEQVFQLLAEMEE